jgi:hypothetical protein
MDHDVKRVVAAKVASIHVLLQQNYAGRCAKLSGRRKRLERRGDVALYRSCVAMRPCNTNIFGGGGVEWIQETQLDDANISPIVFLRY